MLKLYHNDMSSCAQKVRITLAEKGLPWEGFHLSPVSYTHLTLPTTPYV